MAVKQYLDYAGLQELVSKIKEKYAGIEALTFKGVVEDIAHLPSVNTQEVGWMYTVTVGGGTTSDFVEGAGHTLQDGENVAIVELITGYTMAEPVGTENPKKLGWYELDGVTYIPTNDVEVDFNKDYYTANTVKKWDILGGVFKITDRLQFGDEMPSNPEDGQTFLYMGDTTYIYNEVEPAGTENPSEEGWYEIINNEYVLTSDTQVEAGKTYYEKGDEQYVTGVVYVYDATEGEWAGQTAGDTYSPITVAEVDALFD